MEDDKDIIIKNAANRDTFIEIRPQDTEEKLPRLVEVYVAQVEPKRCRSLLKLFSQVLPLCDSNGRNLVDLTHLKRVKKSKTSHSASIHKDPQTNPSKKKQKQQDSGNELLEVLLRDVESLEGEFGDDFMKESQSNENNNMCIVEFLKAKYDIPNIVKRMVPGRPPESQQEWQDFQTEYWPTIFFPQRSKEHLDQQLQLSAEEIQQMRFGMEQAIQDSQPTGTAGAVILDPATGKVVARSMEERVLQLEASANAVLNNPLTSPILWAIQGVSRIERNKAISAGMASSEFQKGQYLCTGYDLYAAQEPTVFEAMSLVHSRVRRVVFGQTLDAGGIKSLCINALPSTNHHYRAFQCRPQSDLWKKCQK